MPTDKSATSKVAAARAFASSGHERITASRDVGEQTNESHLKAVAQIVSSVTDDADLIAAAWLHDIVGDTSVTIGQVERRFGRRVAKIVGEITPVAHARRGRAARLAFERRSLAEISDEAKSVKLADLVDTLRDLRRRDTALACALAAEARELAKALAGGDPRLVERLAREIERCGEPSAPPGAPSDTTAKTALSMPLTALKAFARAFSADDIAEPLRSFDGDRDAHDARETMCQAGVEVAGIRTCGLVSGYVEASDLAEGPCALASRPIAPGQVIAADASLGDVIDILTVHDWCFVTTFGSISGVVGRSDVQKPAVRMWLFGIITVAEIEATERVGRKWPDDTWTALVSSARLAKARELFDERRRRKESCRLIDCLQLADKLDILLSDEAELAALGLATANAARRVARQVEQLRNTLAHAQPFADQDWPQIVRLARRVGSAAAD